MRAATVADPRNAMAARMMRIDLNGKSFGQTRILGPIRIEIGPTEAVALVGPSGIGKSTLLRLIAGLDSAIDGSITGVGRLGFVFQEPTLLPWRTARDNITLATGTAPQEADALLRQIGLEDKAALYPAQLSLGQRRRVAIIRAFARRPETLLMDEPFASLDADAATAMRAMLADLLRIRPARLILVTHDETDARMLADRTIRLAGSPAVIVPSGGER